MHPCKNASIHTSVISLNFCKKWAPKHKYFKSYGELGIGSWKLCSATLSCEFGGDGFLLLPSNGLQSLKCVGNGKKNFNVCEIKTPHYGKCLKNYLRYQCTPKLTILPNFSYWYSKVHLIEFFQLQKVLRKKVSFRKSYDEKIVLWINYL